MTLVNTETGVILDAAFAEKRALKIGLDLDGAADRFEAAMEKMRAAINDRDDIALGYRSPGDYLSDRFGGKLARLGVDLRREVVRELTEAGLSTRAIAPIVGASQMTVVRDIETTETFDSVDASPPTVRTTTGLDGRERTTVSAGRMRQVQRDDAEVVMNLIQSLAELLPPSIIGLAWWLFWDIDPDGCQGFWDGMHTGAGLAEESPILVLRNQIIKKAGEPGRIPETVMLAWVIKAWNDWRSDNTRIRPYNLRAGEKFPEPR